MAPVALTRALSLGPPHAGLSAFPGAFMYAPVRFDADQVSAVSLPAEGSLQAVWLRN